jgi:uncharacterized membrane protein
MKIVDVATNPDRNKRFRNLIDMEKAITNPEKLKTYIPETVSEYKVQNDTDYIESWEEKKQILNEEVTAQVKTEKNTSQPEKNVFQILNEIENQKKPEPPIQTQVKSTVIPQAPQNQQQNTNQYTQKQQQQTDYNRTREAIRQSASQQQSQANTPKPPINTSAVVVVGILSVIFGFIFSLV